MVSLPKSFLFLIIAVFLISVGSAADVAPSDVWSSHYEEYRLQYGDDDARIRRKLERERFVLPFAELKDHESGEVKDRFLADYYSLHERRSAANIGELINIVLDAIEEANKAKLESDFRNIDFNSESNLGKTKDRNRRLKTLLEDFNKPLLDMSPGKVSEDVIGNTYIYLIERFASDSGKKAGEFYTPHKISTLVAKLGRPKPGDRICDPTCGSGGLLIEAAREVADRNFALFGMESDIQKIVATVAARQDLEKYAHLASFEELRDNDFNLNIPRYVDTFEEEVEIDIDAVQVEIEQLEKELVEVRAKMAAMLKEIER